MLSRLRLFSQHNHLQVTAAAAAAPALISSVRGKPTRIGGKRPSSSSAAASSAPATPSAKSSSSSVSQTPGSKSDIWSSVLPSVGVDLTSERLRKQKQQQMQQPQQQQKPADDKDRDVGTADTTTTTTTTTMIEEQDIHGPSPVDDVEHHQQQQQQQEEERHHGASEWNPMKSDKFIELLQNIKVSAGPTVSRPEHLLKVNRYDNERQSTTGSAKDIVTLFHELANTTLRSHQLLTVSGQPGVGKSSVVPILLAALLEEDTVKKQFEECSSSDAAADAPQHSCVWMTQPTRAACIGLVHYMTQITNTKVGDAIGYATSEQSNWTLHRTKIIICTPGYAARYLLPSSLENRNDSNGRRRRRMGCHTMIIDEAHAVDEQLETLLSVCALALRERTALVFMSATMDFPVLRRFFAVSHRSTARSLHILSKTSYERLVLYPHHMPRVLAAKDSTHKLLPMRFVRDRLLPSIDDMMSMTARRVGVHAPGTDVGSTAASLSRPSQINLPNTALRDLTELLVRLACSSPKGDTRKAPAEQYQKKRDSFARHRNRNNNKDKDTDKSSNDETKETAAPAAASAENNADDDDPTSVLVFLPGFAEMQHLASQLFRSFKAYTVVDKEGSGDVLYMSRFHIEVPRRFFSAADKDYKYNHERASVTGRLHSESEEADEVVEVMLAHSAVLGNNASASATFGFDMAGEYGETPWFLKGKSLTAGEHKVSDEVVVPGLKFRGRSIVLATNVAESSLTIPHLKFVVDLGLERYEQRSRTMLNTSFLATRWISETSAWQRAGRVGRMSDGFVLRLFDPSFLRREHVGIDTGGVGDSVQVVDDAKSGVAAAAASPSAANEDLAEERMVVVKDAAEDSKDAVLPKVKEEQTRQQEAEALAQQKHHHHHPRSSSTDSSSSLDDDSFTVERLLLACLSIPALPRHHTISELRSSWVHRVSDKAVDSALRRMLHDGYLVRDARFKAGVRLTRAGLVVGHLPLPLVHGRFIWFSLLFGCSVDALLLSTIQQSTGDLFIATSVRHLPETENDGGFRLRDSTITAAAAAAAASLPDGPLPDDVDRSQSDLDDLRERAEKRRRAAEARARMDPFRMSYLARLEYGIESHLSDPWMLRQLFADWLSMPRRAMRRRQTGPNSRLSFETRYLKPQTMFTDRVGIRSRRFDELDAAIIRTAKSLDEALSMSLDYDGEEDDNDGANNNNNNKRWLDEIAQLRALQVLVRTGCAIGDKQLEACEALFGPMPERMWRELRDESYDEEDVKQAMRRHNYNGRSSSRHAVALNEQRRRSRLLMAFAAAFGDKLLVGLSSAPHYQRLFATSMETGVVSSEPRPLPALLSSRTDKSLLVVRVPHATMFVEGGQQEDKKRNNNNKRKLVRLPPDVLANRFLLQFVRPSLRDQCRVDIRGSTAFLSFGDIEEQKQQQSTDNKNTQQVRYDLGQPPPCISFAPMETHRSHNLLLSEGNKMHVQLPRSEFVEAEEEEEVVTVASPAAAVEEEADNSSSSSVEEKNEQRPADNDPEWIVIPVSPPRRRLRQLPRVPELFMCDREAGRWLAFRRRDCDKLGLTEEVQEIEKIASVLSVSLSSDSPSSSSAAAVKPTDVDDDLIVDDDDALDVDDDLIVDEDKEAKKLKQQDNMKKKKKNDEKMKQQQHKSLSDADPFVTLTADPLRTHVMHHPSFFVVGRYEQPRTATRRFKLNEAMTAIGAVSESQSNTDNSKGDDDSAASSQADGFDPYLKPTTPSSSSARNTERQLQQQQQQKQEAQEARRRQSLLQLVEEDDGGSVSGGSSSSNVSGGGSAEGDDAIDRAAARALRSDAEQHTDSGDRRRHKDTAATAHQQLDATAISSIESGGMQISRVKRQHCALCNTLIPRLAAVAGHRYSTRHLMRLCALLQQQVPLSEVCRLFSSEPACNVVASDSNNNNKNNNNSAEERPLPLPSTSYSLAARIAGPSHLSGLRFQPSFERASTRAGWTDGVLFGFASVFNMPSPFAHLYRSGYIRNSWLLPPSPTLVPNRIATIKSSADDTVGRSNAPTTSGRALVDDLLLSVVVAGASAGHGLRLLVEATPSQVVALAGIQAFPYPPMALATPAPIDHPAVVALLDVVAMCRNALGGVRNSDDARRLRKHFFKLSSVTAASVQAELSAPAVVPTTAGAAAVQDTVVRVMVARPDGTASAQEPLQQKQQQEQRRSPFADDDASLLERVWIAFDAERVDAMEQVDDVEDSRRRGRGVHNDTRFQKSRSELVLTARLPPSAHATPTASPSEARLLNAVLMSLTADSPDGRVSVDRIVRRFVLQSNREAAATLAQQTATTSPEKPSATTTSNNSNSTIPVIFSNVDALRELDDLCIAKGYASLYELLVLGCGAVPVEAQLGALTVPVGVDERNAPCGTLLMSRELLPSRVLAREEAAKTAGLSEV